MGYKISRIENIKEVEEFLKEGGVLLKQFSFSAQSWFKTYEDLIKLSEVLLKGYPAVTVSLCLGIIEGIGHIKYYNLLANNKRFKNVIRDYGKQTEGFNNEYLPVLWDVYRCKLAHEWGMPSDYFKDIKKGFGKISFLKISDELKPKKPDMLEITIISPKKIIQITKNCLSGFKKELKPIKRSVFIHTIQPSKKKPDPVVYIRDSKKEIKK